MDDSALTRYALTTFDSRALLVWAVAFITGAMLTQPIWAILVLIASALLLLPLAPLRIPRFLLRGVCLLALVFSLAFLFSLWALGVSADPAARSSATFSLRLICAVLVGATFFASVSMPSIAHAFAKWGLPSWLSFVVALTLGLVPSFIREGQHISRAQRARAGSTRMRLRRLLRPWAFLLPFVVPYVCTIVRSAEQVTLCLASRGFDPREFRPPAHMMFRVRDWWLVGFGVLVPSGTLIVSYLLV